MKIHLVNLNVSIYEQLQLEEALLRADDCNWCLINHGSPPAIVMGISGKQELLVHPENNLPIIRRFSGGGTVVIDENTLFVTFICNSSDINIPGHPEKIHRWTENLYKPLFDGHAFALRENDFVIGERKFGGNAQYIRKDRWLHHSSLLWSYQPEHMNKLLHPPKTPKYRAQRSHEEFLCSLNGFFTCKNAFIESIQNQLNQRFHIENMLQDEASSHMTKPHRKSVFKL